MAWYPKAIKKELPREYAGYRPLTIFNRMNLHVAVSESPSLFGFFNGPGKPSSHFYVRDDGTVEQYIDTDRQAEADLEGNDATISVETQGGMRNPQSEPWTDSQLVALAELFAWAHETHGIPLRLAQDAKIGSSSQGLSWHRLGIDGNFPAAPSPLAGRLQRGGGMHYSHSRGKVCPGDAKILQIPIVLERARAFAGAEVSNPVTPPKPSKPTPKPTPTSPAKPTTPSKAPEYDMDTLDLRNAHSNPVRGKTAGKLQALLMAHGYGPSGLTAASGRPDQIAGAETRRLFGLFQQAHPKTGTNGKPDYVCGDKSWTELIEN